MSAVDLLLPEPVAALPYSVRLAQRRAIALAPKPSNRRAHARRPAHELQWLQRVRLTGGIGVDARLIDLSEGGALLEIDTPLRPGVQMQLELVGEDMEARVPLQIIRCYIASLRGEVTTYRSACAFVHPIELPGTTRAGRPTHADFVGTSAALGYLLERCHTGGERGAEGSARVSLERQQLLHVLESLRARGAAARAAGAGDEQSSHEVDLIDSVLSALHRGDVRQDVVAALEREITRLPGTVQAAMHSTSTQLVELIGHCATPRPALLATAVATVAVAPRAGERPATIVADAGTLTAAATLQKIVVRFADGQLLKGFTQDFHPTRPQFSIWPSVTATPSERVVVPVAKLKALFFVKDFHGNPGYRDRKSFIMKGQGRRVEVTFNDTETILGTTLNYRADGQGFFVHPADSGTNNSRIFVINNAVREVRFL
jgi:PilZ domain